MQLIDKKFQSETAEFTPSNLAGAVREQTLGYFDTKYAPPARAHAVWGAQSPIAIYMVWAPANVEASNLSPSMALVV